MPDVDDFDFRRDRDEESRWSAADHDPGEVAARLAREEAIAKAAEIVRGFGLPGFGRKIGTALADAGLLVTPQHDAEVATRALEEMADAFVPAIAKVLHQRAREIRRGEQP